MNNWPVAEEFSVLIFQCLFVQRQDSQAQIREVSEGAERIAAGVAATDASQWMLQFFAAMNLSPLSFLSVASYTGILELAEEAKVEYQPSGSRSCKPPPLGQQVGHCDTKVNAKPIRFARANKDNVRPPCMRR